MAGVCGTIGVAMILDIRTLTYHMIYNSIFIDSNACCPTGLDNCSKLISSTTSRMQSVPDRLVDEVPWAKLLVGFVLSKCQLKNG
jgi:hypothetical protein